MRKKLGIALLSGLVSVFFLHVECMAWTTCNLDADCNEVGVVCPSQGDSLQEALSNLKNDQSVSAVAICVKEAGTYQPVFLDTIRGDTPKSLTLQSAELTPGGPHVNAIINGGGSSVPVYFYCFRKSFYIDGFTITNGKSSTFYGGGILVDGAYSATIKNCLIQGNTNSYGGQGYGGGVALFSLNNWGNPANITIDNTVFDGNSAATGGAAYIRQAYVGEPINVLIKDCSFINNSGLMSPAMYYKTSESTSTCFIDHCEFIANAATGGWPSSTLRVQSAGDFHIERSLFDSNTGSGWGAINNDNSSGSMDIINSVFTGNRYSYLVGTVNIENSTFADNPTAAFNTVGPSSRINIKNSIFWNPDAIGGEGLSNGFPVIAVSYSDVRGGVSGEGNINNINADPLLHADNIHLRSGSPCIDSGYNFGLISEYDVDGYRPFDGNGDLQSETDMGADEYGVGNP